MHRLSFKQISALSLFLLFFGTLLTAQSYHSNPCKVFIGVETSHIDGGLRVDKTLYNAPAQIYGVQPGDVIVAMDDATVRSQSELLQARDKHQQGESFTLTILRDGVEKNIQARFKACSEAELAASEEKIERKMAEMEIRMEEMQVRMQEQFKGFEMGERAILGVFENTEVNVGGLAIGTVISGKGAEAAGLQPGDIVVKVDGKSITGSSTLRGVLDNHKPGDQVTVEYLRAGKNLQTGLTLSADRAFYNFKTERDPCKVFIGVYTSGHALEGRGARVDGVIDDTPAKQSGVQPGDIIMAFNGQAVNSHQEILVERDKNKPGDAFRMTVLRDGATIEINARFKSCDTPVEASVQEKVEVLEEDSPAPREAPKSLDNTLNLLVFEAFPNPTFGGLNIQFEAEAVPTTVRIQDAAGRVVYRKDLPQFGGTFNEQVNLSNNKAGNYTLSIQQGDKVQSKQIVVLPRA